MKTLNDFKDEVAREDGYQYDGWQEMKDILKFHKEEHLILERLDLAAQRYAEYMAIEFAEFISNNKFSIITRDNIWTSELIEYSGCAYTTKELFDMFRKNKQ